MKTHAQVVVVGGGVVGVSTLYHLAKKGLDAVLCERTELTAGSTWHAAGLLPLFNMSYAVGQIHKYSVDLYKTLEAETGQDVSFHVTGNLRLATNQERMDEYLKYCGTANTIGVPFEIITPAEVKKLWPLCNTEGLVGALYHPHDGHIAPVDLTNALAKGARNMGAEIYRNTEVTALAQKANDEWVVTTSGGEITAEHVVLASGNYARQTGRMAGLEVPAIPVEHQYIVTDVSQELKEYREGGGRELAVLRESDASYYLREERLGYILGPYEKGAPARFADGVPATFEKDLFPGDLERLTPHVEAVMHRVPSFANAGIKDIVNGPISYTPDGNPMVGPAWGRRNLWLNEGHSFGVTAAGGSGWQLAEWIAEGEPGIDMLGVDPRRYGEYACKPYTVKKNEEAYEHVFVIHYPDEERPACRPAKTSPIHDKLDALGAVWGQRYGWERPNWFAPKGVAREDDWSFRRSAYWQHVGNEHRNIRDNVGIIDITSFSKFLLGGPGAEAYLDRLVCRKLPKKEGRIHLAHALTIRGGVRSEFTITREGADAFYLVSSGAAQRYDLDFLSKWMPRDGSVTLQELTTSHATLVVAGPNARKVLQKITEEDLSGENFPWLSARHTYVGLAPVRLLRVNFVGELGWELHHPMCDMEKLYDALMEAGREFGVANFGVYAVNAMRLEKAYKAWGAELTTEIVPAEAGIERFVKYDKDFIGKAAALAQKERGLRMRIVYLTVSDGDNDVSGNEPLFEKGGGDIIGVTTSGAFGHSVGRSIAFAYVKPELAAAGTKLEIAMLGQRRQATVAECAVYDPDNAKLRA